MFTSQIIQIFLDIDKERDGLYLDKKKYEAEWDEVVKCEKELSKKFGNKKELHDLYRKLDLALGTYHYLELKEMFRKAFILGAQVALEICGVEGESD